MNSEVDGDLRAPSDWSAAENAPGGRVPPSTGADPRETIVSAVIAVAVDSALAESSPVHQPPGTRSLSSAEVARSSARSRRTLRATSAFIQRRAGVPAESAARRG